MATSLIKLPDLPSPLKEIASAAVFIADAPIAYDTTSGTLFNVPSNTLIVAIGVIVDTAFAGASPELTISDTTGVLYRKEGLADAGNTALQLINRVNSGSITYAISTRGTLTAGAATVVVLYKTEKGLEPRALT